MSNLTDREKENLESFLADGSYKTSDPWHSYERNGVTIYQWGIIQDRSWSDPSHLTIIFETPDRTEFDAKRAAAEIIIREWGRSP